MEQLIQTHYQLVGASAVKTIVDERKNNGPYNSIFDLSDFSGCKTSLPSGKKYQWALESDCCSFVRGFSEKLLLQYDKQKKSLNFIALQ